MPKHTIIMSHNESETNSHIPAHKQHRIQQLRPSADSCRL